VLCQRVHIVVIKTFFIFILLVAAAHLCESKFRELLVRVVIERLQKFIHLLRVGLSVAVDDTIDLCPLLRLALATFADLIDGDVLADLRDLDVIVLQPVRDLLLEMLGLG